MSVKLVAFAILGIGLAVTALFYFVRDNFENKPYEYGHHQSGNRSYYASGYDSNSWNKKTGTCKKSKCSICQDDLPTGLGKRELKCGHAFHAKCINRWIQEEPICPNCRKHI